MQHDPVLKKLNFDLLREGGGGGGAAGKIFAIILQTEVFEKLW